MSIQEKISETLKQSGIPYKDISVYGRQIVVTSWSNDAADKWAQLIANFATVRGITRSFDDAKENKGTVLNPTAIQVWRTFAKI